MGVSETNRLQANYQIPNTLVFITRREGVSPCCASHYGTLEGHVQEGSLELPVKVFKLIIQPCH